MQCDRCAGDQFTRAGRDRKARQLYRCQACGRRLTTRSGSAFSGYRFPDEVIALAVRWYLRYRLSYADVVEWLAERGMSVVRPRSTIGSAASRHASSRRHGPTAPKVARAGAWRRPPSRLPRAGTTSSEPSTNRGSLSMCT